MGAESHVDYSDQSILSKAFEKCWASSWNMLRIALHTTGLVDWCLWRPIYWFLGWLHKQQIIEMSFMNYGYQYTAEAQKDVLKIPEGFITQRPVFDQNNIRLYEKTLSACPRYPDQLRGLDYLELACGHGGGIEWMLEAHPDFASVQGLDYVLAVEHENIIRGDVHDMPFGDSCKDIVQVVEATHAFKYQPKFLSEAYRVLRPGGYLLSADFRPEDHLLEDLHDQAKAVGFELLSETNINENVLLSRREQSAAMHKLYSGNVFTRYTKNLIWSHFWALEGCGMYNMLNDGHMTYFIWCWQKPL